MKKDISPLVKVLAYSVIFVVGLLVGYSVGVDDSKLYNKLEKEMYGDDDFDDFYDEDLD